MDRRKLIDQGRFFHEEGISKWNCNDLLGAGASFMRAYAVASEAEHVVGQAAALGQLRQVVHDVAAKAEIDRMAAETVALAERLPVDSDEKAEAYGLLGMYYDLAENLKTAEDYLRQACGLNASVGNGKREAACWNHLGIVYRQLYMGGDKQAFEMAEEAYHKAEKLNMALGRVEMAQANRGNLEALWELRERKR